MVDQPVITTGIDAVGADYLTAQVEKSDSIVRVLALSKIAAGEISRSLLSDNGEIVLSVPDNEVTIKNLTIPQKYHNRRSDAVRFELQNALLDEPAGFCYDMVETTESSQIMTIIARREKLEANSCVIQIGEDTKIEPAGFVARSIALGRGFIQFCSNDTERLVGLVDLGTKRAALTFVLGNRIIATANFDRTQFDASSESGFAKLTAELKTIINFKLNELNNKGVNLSLARLIITGSVLDRMQKEAIAVRLEVQLEEPIFDRVLTDKPLIESNISLSDFLVPLGLTVE